MQVAAGARSALINVGDDDLAIYPAKDTLDARQGRIEQVPPPSARLAGMPTVPPCRRPNGVLRRPHLPRGLPVRRLPCRAANLP